MPAKKTTRKTVKKATRSAKRQPTVVVSLSYQQLFFQSMILAIVSAIATYSILKAGMLRDEVDKQLMAVLAEPSIHATVKNVQ